MKGQGYHFKCKCACAPPPPRWFVRCDISSNYCAAVDVQPDRFSQQPLPIVVSVFTLSSGLLPGPQLTLSRAPWKTVGSALSQVPLRKMLCFTTFFFVSLKIHKSFVHPVVDECIFREQPLQLNQYQIFQHEPYMLKTPKLHSEK